MLISRAQPVAHYISLHLPKSQFFHCGFQKRLLAVLALTAVILYSPNSGLAQKDSEAAATPDAFLPDAPEPQAAAQSTTPSSSQPTSPVDKIQAKLGLRRADPKTIDPSQQAIPLTASDKIRLSFVQQATPFAVASMVVAAGWEHLHDGDPKYGSDSAGFGERLGAAAIRQTSQSVFADGLAAAAFHEDPRFYRMATGSFGRRAFYAASRTWETRTDSGAPTINYSRLTGYAGASILTKAYYPAVSATWSRVAAGYGWSLIGNMAGNQYHEFWPDVLHKVFRRPYKTP